MYFQINGQQEKAIALLKMQTEMNPGNQNFQYELTHYYYLTGRFKELLELRQLLAAKNPNPDAQLNVAEALILNGEIDKAGEIFSAFLNKYPNQPGALTGQTSFYALSGQMEKAKAGLQKIVLQDPEFEPLANHYFEAFQYASDHPFSLEKVKNYPGLYRLQNLAMEIEVAVVANLLFGKGRKNTSGYFFIPSGPDEYLTGDRIVLEKWKFHSDSIGRIYKITTQRIHRNQPVSNYVLWRQDSIIRKGKAMLAIGKKEAALETFRIAKLQNPQHFYLDQYIQHLEFVLAPENQNALENMEKFVGRYGPRHIWMEGDNFYYQRDSLISKQRLLPLSPDRFYFEGGFEYQMQIVLEDGQVKGSVSWQYDPEEGQFVRDDDDYLPRSIEQ